MNEIIKDKDKMKVMSQVSRGNLEELILQKEELQLRMKELKDKKNELQDKLLKDEINSEEYGKKKRQIDLFIEETEQELSKINNQLK